MKKKGLLAIGLAMCLLMSGCKSYRHRSGNDAVKAVKQMTVKEHRVNGCVAENYEMDITLDTEADAVYGTSVVKVTNQTNAPLETLCFRLYSANISSGTISAASNVDTGHEYKVETKKDPSVIYLGLNGDSLQPGDSLSVKVVFRSEIDQVEGRLGYIGDGKGKLYSMSFCFPQLAFFENGKWFEAEYEAKGESYCYDMTNYHVTLSAPADYVVMSSGEAETVDGKTVIEAPNVREMAIVACNFAQIQSRESNGITYNILTPEYSGMDGQYRADFYDTILTVAVESAEMYSEKVGAYLYDELDVIPMRFESFGGMEMPGLVQIQIPIVNEGDSSSYLCSTSAVATAHEVGHQWFYCAVSNDTSTEPWLDESFASYLEYLYWDEFVTGKNAVDAFNRKYAPDTLHGESVTRFGEANSWEGEYYINLPVYDYSDSDYGEVVYMEGAWFLRELELAMGSDRFFEMLSGWYQENRNQVVTGGAFVAHILEYDSSQTVQNVINEYIWEEAL